MSSKKTHRQRRRRREYTCPFCNRVVRFCWFCRHCDFQICQVCMNENLWGLTCNNITWECPDCGEWNGFGNQ